MQINEHLSSFGNRHQRWLQKQERRAAKVAAAAAAGDTCKQQQQQHVKEKEGTGELYGAAAADKAAANAIDVPGDTAAAAAGSAAAAAAAEPADPEAVWVLSDDEVSGVAVAVSLLCHRCVPSMPCGSDSCGAAHARCFKVTR
jgi:hypothetical protein